MSDYPAGWYDDPEDQSRERYWDGQQWTADVRGKHPPGWYDDPQRFGAQRYWDGSGWTQDVQFLTRLDGLYETIAFRKKEVRLIVSGGHLAWGEDSMRWDDVTGFNSLTQIQNGITVSHTIWVTGNDSKMTIALAMGRGNDRTETAFRTVLDSAQRIITPRILNELFPRADAGETIEYEKVSLSPQGFAKRDKDMVPWSEYGGWRTQNQLLEIKKMKGDKAKSAVKVTTTQLGRWVLTRLIEDYASRYGAQAQTPAPTS